MRLLVTGAAGAGTSTLAAAIAGAIGGLHIEADDFLWHATTPPFQMQRAADERLAAVMDALNAGGRDVLAGSVMGWGVELEDSFDGIVFLRVDTAIRLERIRQREMRRFGRIDPAFLAWAAQYDAGPPEGRSLAKHLAWLAARTCPIVRLEGAMRVEAQMAALSARCLDVAARVRRSSETAHGEPVEAPRGPSTGSG